MSGVLLRLSDAEREELKILNAALKVSEYTDDVDNIRSQRTDKMLTAMLELFQIVTGLAAAGHRLGDELTKRMADKGLNPASFDGMMGKYFEVGRRFKRLNPDKMRSEYGKLIMLLQDTRTRRMEVRLQNFDSANLVRPLTTVGGTLKHIGAQELLLDSQLPIASAYLDSAQNLKELGPKKDAARQALIKKYGGDDPAKEELIERCIRSLDDATVFVKTNVEIINQLKVWLKTLFMDGDPGRKGYNLSIRSGSNGSCLSHDHKSHCLYVMESLTLWGIIHENIFDFWEVVEEDMIGEAANGYRFCDTGQGFHRVCSGPRTYSRMASALRKARDEMGGWVGSSVVHLGDQDVPNALVFIDKYTIIPKLLGPIVNTIKEIDRIFADPAPVEGSAAAGGGGEGSMEDPTASQTASAGTAANTGDPIYPGLRNLLKAKYGNGESLKVRILGDFFRHGFDGSGDDGGSCIDGRLTSAWNWTSLIDKKDYYDAFTLTGFTGFDAAYQ